LEGITQKRRFNGKGLDEWVKVRHLSSREGGRIGRIELGGYYSRFPFLLNSLPILRL